MKQVSRRTMLRAAGVSMGLPWLEAMAAERLEPSGAPKRLVCLFFPNGVYPQAWDPKGSGKNWELSEILAPLAAHKHDVSVISNLGTPAQGHIAATTAFLTGTPLQVPATAPALIPNLGISLDQAVARKIGGATKLASIELGTEPPRGGGEANLPVSFASTVSWSGPSTKVDPEISPAAAFDRLFGDPNSKRERAIRDRSLLDGVMADARRLQTRISSSDKRKLDEYFTSVRDVEKRIQDSLSPRASSWTPKSKVEMMARPEDGVPVRRDVHLRMMQDLLVLALQTDSTRVATLMMAHGFSRQNFTFLDGVKGDHHSISHHKEDPELTRPYTIVSRWYVSQFAYLLDRMKSIDEGDGSLLDHSAVLFGGELRDGNGHVTRNLPIVVAGRAHGALAHGSHIVLPKNTALANLHLTMMRAMGIQAEKFNTSTGLIRELAGPSADFGA